MQKSLDSTRNYRYLVSVTIFLATLVAGWAYWNAQRHSSPLVIRKVGTYTYNYRWLKGLQISRNGDTLTVTSKIGTLGRQTFWGILSKTIPQQRTNKFSISGDWAIEVDPENQAYIFINEDEYQGFVKWLTPGDSQNDSVFRNGGVFHGKGHPRDYRFRKEIEKIDPNPSDNTPSP